MQTQLLSGRQWDETMESTGPCYPEPQLLGATLVP